jgi:DNA polymerase-3 subunit alpha
VPLASLKPEHDKKAVVVGGVISSVRQIITKSGTKMAFVALEDKSGEGEVVVFPSLFEEIGSRLVQDEVVKVEGKISSTDRQGNSLGEAKIIADTFIFVSGEELDNYKATGKKMKELKPRKAKPDTAKKTAVDEPKYTYSPVDDREPPKLYVRVTDPSDHGKLHSLKQLLNNFLGDSEIILVLGSDKSSAMRLPFRIDPHPDLQSAIGELYGTEHVVVK